MDHQDHDHFAGGDGFGEDTFNGEDPFAGEGDAAAADSMDVDGIDNGVSVFLFFFLLFVRLILTHIV